MDCRPGLLPQAAQKHALGAKVGMSPPGSPRFPCRVPDPRAQSTPRIPGHKKVRTTSLFNLVNPGERSRYLIIDLPPPFPGPEPRKEQGEHGLFG